jgi:hypothetical protein
VTAGAARRGLPLAALAVPLLSAAGCSALWPSLVRESPDEPLFGTAGLLRGPLRTDGALCSLATVGPEALRLVSPPRPPARRVPLREACGGGAATPRGEAIAVLTAQGEAIAHLWREPGATGLVVAFSGLGMPPEGWINSRLAELGAGRGLATLAVVRDESARPIVLDPLREARRALDAAAQVQAACGLGGSLAFVGISLGGLEALLANREAARAGLSTRAAVLDPVLDVAAATSHLDSSWHDFGDDGMQAYFRRILRGRYGEPEGTRFGDLMRRLEGRPGALTRPAEDSPSAWLCTVPSGRFAVFLSDTDPVLGDEQRQFGLACHYPFVAAKVPGHTPFACRLELFEELLEALGPGGPAAQR